MSRSMHLALAFALAAPVAGCASDPPPAPSAPAAARASTPPAASRASSGTQSTVAISDDIRSRCGISDSDAYFGFDSARLTTQDHSPLDLVARCFANGPLSGRTVKLVGRTDPRGAAEYNMTLGQSRANAVGVYLVSHGVSTSHETSTSRGALDASGTDGSSWARDRRVDVLLGN